MRLSATTAFIAILSSYPALSMPLNAPSSLNSPYLAFAPIAAATLPPNVLDAIRNRLSQLQSRDVQGLMERENVAGLAREIEELFARDVEDDSEASDSDYDTDDEDQLREMFREAMDTAAATPDFFDPRAAASEFDAMAADRKGNPFIKMLGNLRGE